MMNVDQEEPPVLGFTMSAQDPEVLRRREICRTCEFLFLNKAYENIMGQNAKQCAKCNCFVNLKTKFRNFHCPLRKW